MKEEENDLKLQGSTSNPFATVITGILEGHLDSINCLETLSFYQNCSSLTQECKGDKFESIKTDPINLDIIDRYNSLILSGSDDGTIRVWSTNFEVDKEICSTTTSSSTSLITLPMAYSKNQFRSKMCYRKEIFDGFPVTSLKSFSYRYGALDKGQSSFENENSDHIKKQNISNSLLGQCSIKKDEGKLIHRILATAGTSVYILNFDVDAYRNEPIIIVNEAYAHLSNFALDEINATAIYNDRTKRNQYLHLLNEDKDQNTILTVDDHGDICFIRIPLHEVSSSFDLDSQPKLNGNTESSNSSISNEITQPLIVEKWVYPNQIQSPLKIQSKNEDLPLFSEGATMSQSIDKYDTMLSCVEFRPTSPNEFVIGELNGSISFWEKTKTSKTPVLILPLPIASNYVYQYPIPTSRNKSTSKKKIKKLDKKTQAQTPHQEQEQKLASLAGNDNQFLNPPFVYDIAYSVDGNFLFVACGNGTIPVIHVEKKCQMTILEPEIHFTKSDANSEKTANTSQSYNSTTQIFSPVTKLHVTYDWYSWDVEKVKDFNRLTETSKARGRKPKNFSLLEKDRPKEPCCYLISCTNDQAIRIWDITSLLKINKKDLTSASALNNAVSGVKLCHKIVGLKYKANAITSSISESGVKTLYIGDTSNKLRVYLFPFL